MSKKMETTKEVEKRVIEEVIKWADENMADGDYTYEKLLLFLKSKYE